MKISVEMTVQENGVVKESRGYLRDSAIELTDLLEWTKSQLLVIADQTLTEEQEKGFDKEPVMLVDGKPNKAVRSVSPLGQIEFIARADFQEVLFDTYISLMRRSPVKSGRYIDSHYVFHNGIQIANDYARLQKWANSGPELKDNDTIRIVNIQPYARRLELLGVTAQRTQSRKEDAGRRNKKKKGVMVRMPNGAYQLTARAIKAKYKNNLGIRFTFLPGTSLGLSGVFKGGRKKNSSGRPYLYPTIAFTINSRGLT